jgi:hypothetical protein
VLRGAALPLGVQPSYFASSWSASHSSPLSITISPTRLNLTIDLQDGRHTETTEETVQTAVTFS